MKDVKMGLTIEEGAEMSRIGRNTMRKLVDWGEAPCTQSGTEDDHPKGCTGELYGRQSGEKPAQSGRRPGGALRDGHSRKKASPFESAV